MKEYNSITAGKKDRRSLIYLFYFLNTIQSWPWEVRILLKLVWKRETINYVLLDFEI